MNDSFLFVLWCTLVISNVVILDFDTKNALNMLSRFKVTVIYYSK